MSASEFFEDVARARRSMSSAQQSLEERRETIDGIRGTLEGAGGSTPPSDRIAALLEGVYAALDRYVATVHRYGDLVDTAELVLQRLDDATEAAILRRYYIDGAHHRTIADELGYSEGYVRIRKMAALEHAEPLVPRSW